MDLEGEVLRWKFNPLYINFKEDKIKKAFTQYMNIVRLLDYNPQKVGKDSSTYYEADSLMQKLLEMWAQGGLSVADGCRCLTKELDMIAC